MNAPTIETLARRLDRVERENRRLRLAEILALALISAAVLGPTMLGAEQGTDKNCKEWHDAFPCKLEIISWVGVRFQGDLLKKYKSDFERLIRFRLRNDLSMISHEVKGLGELVVEIAKDPSIDSSKELKRRGEVSCLVWTVGKDYPVATFVECKLSGWGSYSITIYDKFESQMLGYSSAREAREQVERSIRTAITNISADFLEARDKIRNIPKEILEQSRGVK